MLNFYDPNMMNITIRQKIYCLYPYSIREFFPRKKNYLHLYPQYASVSDLFSSLIARTTMARSLLVSLNHLDVATTTIAWRWHPRPSMSEISKRRRRQPAAGAHLPTAQWWRRALLSVVLCRLLPLRQLPTLS
jgi:hypothetical protein